MMRVRPDELRADMQQYYGLDMDEAGGRLRHYACCAAQLPADSRVMRAENKTNEWSVSDYLLRLVDYRLQGIAYLLANGELEEPRMVQSPADLQDVADALRRSDPRRVADALGIPEDRR